MMTDSFSDEIRKRYEGLIVQDGYCSPRGSVHTCVRCRLRIRWVDLVWESRSYPYGDCIVAGVHECIKNGVNANDLPQLVNEGR